MLIPKESGIVFKRNGYDHRVIRFIGSDSTGEQEIRLLKIVDCRVEDHANQMLLLYGEDSYDAKHRFVKGRPYEIVFMPGTCIPRDKDRTVINLRAKAVKDFGYSEALGGVAPYLCGIIEQMERIESEHTFVVHPPIPAADFNPYMLGVHFPRDGRPCLDSCPGHPHHQLDSGVMLVFFSHPND